MASQASFAIMFRQQFAGYLGLSTGFNELLYCICLPLKRQQSFYSTDFSCCREFKFQYNGLQLAPEAAKLSPLRSLMEVEIIFHNTRREQWLGHCYSKSLPRFKECS